MGLTCGGLFNFVIVLFTACVIVLASAHAYHNYQQNTLRLDQAQYAVNALHHHPKLEAIPYLNEGFQRAKNEAKQSPLVSAIMQTIMESKPYQIYNIKPQLVWAALFVLVLLCLIQEYKLRSERAIASQIAQSSTASLAHMGSMVSAVAAARAPQIDEQHLAKALRAAARDERRDREQQAKTKTPTQRAADAAAHAPPLTALVD